MQELQRTTRESKHATERTAILAAVVPEKAHPFVLEELDLDEPREDEVLVRVVATGEWLSGLVQPSRRSKRVITS